MNRFRSTLVVGALVAAAAGVVVTGSGAALATGSPTPWAPGGVSQDPHAVGGLEFFNASGDRITGGSTTDGPFAAYVAGLSATRAITDTKATIFGYVPQVGQTPDTWAADETVGLATNYPASASAPTPINGTALPVKTGLSSDETLADLANDLPNSATTTGYVNTYELRMFTSSQGNGISVNYDYADITINTTTDTWALVFSPDATGTATTSTLAASSTTVNKGASVTLTDTISPASAGTVRFADNGVAFGSPVTVTNGIASTSTVVSVGGANNYTADFTPADLSGVAGSTSNTVTVGAFAITVTPTSLSAGVVQKAYTAKLAETGGTGKVTWSLAGTLPPGLLLSTAGQITGTPTAVGTSTFTVNVTDSATPANFGTETLSITIAPISITVPVTVVGTALPAATIGVALKPAAFKAVGGKTPLKWSATGLPAGVTFSTSGSLAGTPSAVGSFTIVFAVTDAAKPVANTAHVTLTLVVNPMSITVPATVVNSALPNAVVGIALKAAAFKAVGGKAPLKWSATGLPPGVTFSTAGSLAGTPTTPGSYSITIKVTDSSKPSAATAQVSVTMLVLPMTLPATTLADGHLKKPYAAAIPISGGKSPFKWVVSNGALPAGIKLTATTGKLSGTPTALGTYTFTLTVTDGSKPTANSASQTYTIVVD